MTIYTAALRSFNAQYLCISICIAPILQMEEAGSREVLPQEAFGRAK